MKKKCKVGTRSSKLALWQTNHVLSLLKLEFPDCHFEIIEMSTKGDRILNQSLSAIGDKGLFTQELEIAMINGDIDFAVHSLKDMPTKLPDGLDMTAYMKREDPRDALLIKNGNSIDDLPENAIVGTSSLRRKAQILKVRPDLRVVDLRGNIQTRIEKFLTAEYDAAILAVVGLERMNLEQYISLRLPVQQFVPAVGQGIIGIESRIDDEELLEMLNKINDTDSFLCAQAERSFMKALEGGCQIPIGALCQVIDKKLHLTGFIGSLDGETTIYDNINGNFDEAESLGYSLANRMRENGGNDILNNIIKN